MSETQNTPEEIDPLEPNNMLELPPTPIVQAGEVILPVIMRKGKDIGILGDAVFDSESRKMVVSFNTPDGRDIAEFIGSGMLAAISFQGHMSKSEHFNKN